jgi:hypothetical protein
MITQARIFAPYLCRPLELTLTLLIDLRIGVLFPISFQVREHLCTVCYPYTVQVT